MKKLICFMIMLLFLCACRDSSLVKINDPQSEIKVYLIDSTFDESRYKEESIILDKKIEAFIIDELKSIKNNSKVDSFNKKEDYIIVEINNDKYYLNNSGQFYYDGKCYDLDNNDVFKRVCEKLQIGKYNISINFKKLSEFKYIEYSLISYNTTDEFENLKLGQLIKNTKPINYDTKKIEEKKKEITIIMDNKYSIHNSRNYAFEYGGEMESVDSSYVLIEYYNTSSVVMKKNVSLKGKVNIVL